MQKNFSSSNIGLFHPLMTPASKTTSIISITYLYLIHYFYLILFKSMENHTNNETTLKLDIKINEKLPKFRWQNILKKGAYQCLGCVYMHWNERNY